MPISEPNDCCIVKCDFAVSRYVSWFGGRGQDLPDVQFVDAMQRRRLSTLAKVGLGVMHACAAGFEGYSVVFASRHGELSRTTGLLEQLAAGEQVSPIGFSLAVLNAIPGVYSIASHNLQPSSAVSAGERTFEFGLLEAVLQAKSSLAPVLYVYADEPVPAVYSSLSDGEVLQAIAMMIHADSVPGGVGVVVQSESSEGGASVGSQSELFDLAWMRQQPGRWVGGHGQVWSWTFQ
jgi:hypothetical protein